MKCAKCGAELTDGSQFCNVCGEKIASQSGTAQAMQVETKKDPAMAFLLSLVGALFTFGLLNGLGQIYNGQIKKGIILGLANILVWGATFLVYILLASMVYIVKIWFDMKTLGSVDPNSGNTGPCCCIPVLFLPVLLWLYSMRNAYMTASQIKKGIPVKDWLE